MIVAALEPDSIAHRALEQEGIEHEEHICEGSMGYAEMLTDAWGRGGFVSVEHDVVPWVGAIRELEGCESDWCSFPHAKAGRTVRSLGLIRFSDRFVDENPELPEAWQDEPWQTLEREVLVAAMEVAPMCEHLPAVGHARRADGVSGG